MQLNIPHDQVQRLVVLASAAGYPAVEDYVAEQVLAWAELSSPEDLEKSVQSIKRGDAEISAGKGIEAEVALEQIAAKHGLTFRR